jgi:nitric oxide reductase subunit B
MVQGALLAYLLIRLSGIDREVMEKWLYVIVALTFISGLLGTAHHYYFVGVPSYWLPDRRLLLGPRAARVRGDVGLCLPGDPPIGVRAPEHTRRPLDDRQRALFGPRRGTARPCAHLAVGQQVDARHPHHAHARAFGYVMIVLAMITYAMPPLMGHPESQRESKIGLWAFWLQVGGMFGMTMAFAAAGIGQVYLERILGFGYLETQAKIQVHFLMLVGTGILFTSGVVLFLWDFFFLAPRHGTQSDVAAQGAPTPA